MLSLVLNTSSSKGSAALFENTQVLRSKVWEKSQNASTTSSHSEVTTPHLQDIFFNQHPLNELKLMICGKGPGSFTGLRVTLAVVKSLSYINDLPIIATDDCFNIALNSWSHKQLPIVVMIDAQKNSVFLGRYSWEGSILKTITEPYLCPLTEIESALASQTHLCLGDGYLHYFPYLKESLQKKLHRHHQSSDTPHAETMGHYILKNKSLFTHTSWKHVHPLYLRASAAEEVRENRLKHQ